MGKDRRKKETGKRQTTPTPSEAESEPKGQRAPRVRAHQREVPKNTEVSVKEKTPSDPPAPQEEKKEEPINTAELFANLKRETDDIKALTTKKYAKRQIFSNWERYEEPPPPPQYEVEIQGADFEALLQAPDSGAGHFQFKSEKAWNANVSALSGELFSLDIDLLADGLATIPLYKKLDIPITLYSADEILEMDVVAKSALKQYETTKRNMKKPRDKKEDASMTTNRLLGLLMDKELSPAPLDKNASEGKNELNFDIDQPESQNDVADSDVNANMVKTEPHSNTYSNPVPEIDNIPNRRYSPPPRPAEKQPRYIKEEISNDVLETRSQVPTIETKEEISLLREVKQELLPSKETVRENHLTKDIKRIVKEATPPKDIQRVTKEVTPPRESKVEVLEQEIQQPQLESPQNVFQEPVAPLGPRGGRRKVKGNTLTSESQSKAMENQSKSEILESQNKVQITEDQSKIQLSEKQNAERQHRTPNSEKQRKDKESISGKQSKVQISDSQLKPQVAEKQTNVQQSRRPSQPKQTMPHEPEDDLDFLLSLKKPIKETPVSGLQQSQVTKPSIEEDDAAPDPQLTLVNPQKTEDLEDWLDSMLDD